MFLYPREQAPDTTCLMQATVSNGLHKPVRHRPVSEGASSAVAAAQGNGHILAALNDSPATNQVLIAARGLCNLLAADVKALHVVEGHDSSDVADQLSRSAGVELRMTRGPVAEKILEALSAPEIFGTVIGVRAFPGGPRPAGTIALKVISGASKPVLLVPPDARNLSPEAPRRLLVPLDGSMTATDAFLRLEQRFIADEERQINVLLTFNSLAPPMLDHHPHGIEAWGSEFLARYCPGDRRTLHCREGDPGNAVIEVAHQTQSDLIVLSFGGDIEVGHAAVIREVLSRAPVPVLILPTG